MRIKPGIYIGIIFSMLLVMFSCSSSREVVKNAKNINDKDLRETLFAKEVIPFDFFYSKIGIDFSTSETNFSFSATVKMRIDSAFSGTIKAVAIIIATYLVDTDSLAYADKRKKCFGKEDMTFISGLFGTEIGYDFFQSLILGKPVGLDSEIKYKQLKVKDHYILSSHKKKDYKKLDKDRLDLTENEDIFIQYHMSPNSFDLTRINIKVPSDSVEIIIEYKERKLEDEKYWVPEQTNITIYHPKDTITISLNYGAVRINEPKKIRISIPESYEECNK